ncbi:MAG: amidohydrolase [Clostridiales bacterium]|nr:amidohydrolase [Clostridiales bacterium]
MNSILDFHVHPFRDASHCLNFYPERSDFTPALMQLELEKAGITHICGSVLQMKAPKAFSDLRSLNREALALRELLGDFYTPGFHIHPAYVRESCEEVEFMHRQGVHLLGELVPYIHGWGDFDEKNLFQILEAAPRGMVCSYHTPWDFSMENLLSAFPGIIFVAAHPGDRDRVAEHIALMKKHENLYLDLSGTGLFRLGLLKHLVNQVGAERILFGTDYPICNPRMYVQAVYGEDISDCHREKIFFENGMRILKIQKAGKL